MDKSIIMGVDDQLFGIIAAWYTECGGHADWHTGIDTAGDVLLIGLFAGRNDLCAFIVGGHRLGAEAGETDEGDGMDHFFHHPGFGGRQFYCGYA